MSESSTQSNPSSNQVPSNDWYIFKEGANPHSDWLLPAPPAWRPFGVETGPEENRRSQRAETFQPDENAIRMVNAAMYLRRPLLITGQPGTGKSSLAYAVARQLNLGEVLYWPITTRTTRKDGLYDYDAIGRLQDAQQQKSEWELRKLRDESIGNELIAVDHASIGNYITLGPLGTALIPSSKPRVLLIDEIDKSDIDLPNDLLTILEDGRFEIPELVRLKGRLNNQPVPVRTAYTPRENPLPNQPLQYPVPNGVVRCSEFPLVFLTSNGERAFPPAFLRRCLRLKIQPPKGAQLKRIVKAHLGRDVQKRQTAIAQDQGQEAAKTWAATTNQEFNALIKKFESDCEAGTLVSTDQLLNVLFMLVQEHPLGESDLKALKEALMKQLSSAEDG